LEKLTGKNHAWGVNLYSCRLTRRYKLSRFAALVEYWRRKGVLLVSPPARPAYYHTKLPTLVPQDGLELQLFTDGSSTKGNRYSGSAVVARDTNGTPLANLALPILTYGNNYLAELAALTFAAKMAPTGTRCTIYSDSLSGISVGTGGPMSERETVRAPCRGWLSSLRSELAVKPLLSLQYVPAHTNASDPLSKGNDMADRLAKKARGRFFGPPSPRDS
jgi:ribonuclease HI